MMTVSQLFRSWAIPPAGEVEIEDVDRARVFDRRAAEQIEQRAVAVDDGAVFEQVADAIRRMVEHRPIAAKRFAEFELRVRPIVLQFDQRGSPSCRGVDEADEHRRLEVVPEVDVRPRRKPIEHDARFQLGRRHEDDDGLFAGRISFDTTADFDTGDVGEVDVEEHHLRGLAQRERHGFGACSGVDDLVAAGTEDFSP
jgi:hypothetical protein